MTLAPELLAVEEPSREASIPVDGFRRHWIWLALLVLLVTGLNAIKPLHIDDAAFYRNAQQIARNPLNPYGFTAFWSQWPEPGVWALCPPVLPYWWGIAISLFGNSPVMWKVWLLPFVAMFVVSLHQLFRRFARPMEMPLVVLTVLSPTFLPALNLMMDIPALALGLAALCIAVRAIDRGSVRLAALSGVLAALAMQTKYTGAIFPAAICLYGVSHRRLALSILPGIIAAILFGAWEMLIFRRYGISQFIFYLNLRDSMKGLGIQDLLWTAIPILLGALAPMIAILGLSGLNLPRGGLAVAASMVFAGFAVIVFYPVAAISFLILGVGVLAVTALVVYELARRSERDDVFLILWLALELVAFVAVSPFAASRRAMALVVVITLVIGRLACRAGLLPRRRTTVNWIVGGGVALGLGFYCLDLASAFSQKTALEKASTVVHSLKQPGQTVWFGGHWGFQFYAEQAGYQPIIPDHSVLHRGDMLIFPHPLIDAQRATIPPADVDEICKILIDDDVPLSTVPFYYGAGVPVQHRYHARVTVSIYRVTHDFTSMTNYPADFIADWAISRHRPLPPLSVRALLMTMEEVDSATAKKLGNAILSGTAAALRDSLKDADPKVSQTARKLLQSHVAVNNR